MSNQGNIVVIPVDGISAPFIFTTGRWSGNGTPRIAQDVLKLNRTSAGLAVNEDLERCILEDIIKDDAISRPVRYLGNTDTLTVIIDLHEKKVFWRSESDYLVSFVWDLDLYMDLDLLSVPAFQQHFDRS
jgi:hypothetical protein